MAPILKEADTPSATTTATTPASPASKSPNETPTRPQPVPLEIPVTVNGARTVEGSDKREPFSETTQTVLVFPHGAVIRIATPLAPGQLVFLTNEKTKKEVVCQVVKSKTGGSANGYVELQFTEPAPAYWGLRLPGTVAPPLTAPAVPRSAVTVPPTTAKPLSPATMPEAPTPAPLKPAVAPPPPLATPVMPAAPSSLTAPPPPPPPKVSTAAPMHSAKADRTHSVPLVSVPPPSPLASEPIASSEHKSPTPLIPPPAGGPRDFSKDIESLFAVPQARGHEPPKAPAPVVPPPPVVPSSSTEELKQQTARLQQQLSAMLFTEAPATPAKPPAPAVEFRAEPPVAEVANKVLEIAQAEPRPAVQPEAKVEPKPENKPASPVRTPAFSSLNASDEEVAIPSWLRPLSQHAEIIVEEPAATPEGTAVSSLESSSSGVTEMEAVEASTRSDAAVFGGQLLAGDTSETADPSPGSKKGLLFGLAAAVVILAGGGAWYYTTQTHPATTAAPAATQTSPAALPEKPPVVAENVSPTATAPSHGANNTPAPATAAPVNPAPAPLRTPPVGATPPANESHNNGSAAVRNPAPSPEPAKRPALGDVRLSTPVIRGSGQARGSGEALPTIDAPVATPGTDALAAASHGKGPAAPLPIGGDVKPAQLVKSIPPVYPVIAKSQRISGNVTLDALIDASGNVAELKVLSGPPLLHRAALDAVKQWKYKPAQLDGSPTSMHLTVTVQFRAQ